MKLTEIKTDTEHYFIDEQCRKQGEYRDWHDNGKQWEVSHWRNDELHGEFKSWRKNGEPLYHTFDVDGVEIIDFLKNPELYPNTPEERTMFALKYNIGDARFIK